MASRTAEAGTLTEPESLGPCEPGTTINLDGIVWNETKGGRNITTLAGMSKQIVRSITNFLNELSKKIF